MCLLRADEPVSVSRVFARGIATVVGEAAGILGGS